MPVGEILILIASSLLKIFWCWRDMRKIVYNPWETCNHTSSDGFKHVDEYWFPLTVYAIFLHFAWFDTIFCTLMTYYLQSSADREIRYIFLDCSLLYKYWLKRLHLYNITKRLEIKVFFVYYLYLMTYSVQIYSTRRNKSAWRHLICCKITSSENALFPTAG